MKFFITMSRMPPRRGLNLILYSIGEMEGNLYSKTTIFIPTILVGKVTSFFVLRSHFEFPARATASCAHVCINVCMYGLNSITKRNTFTLIQIVLGRYRSLN